MQTWWVYLHTSSGTMRNVCIYYIHMYTHTVTFVYTYYIVCTYVLYIFIYLQIIKSTHYARSSGPLVNWVILLLQIGANLCHSHFSVMFPPHFSVMVCCTRLAGSVPTIFSSFPGYTQIFPHGSPFP